MQDRYNEMLVFARVATLGSFSAAARELELTPSAVSKLISRLEDRLAVRLFQRTTRSLSLTDEGAIFLESCHSILEDIEQAEAEVAALQSRVTGTLHVTAISAFARTQLCKLMPERQVDLINERVDLAILISEEVLDQSLISRKLATNKRVICASPAYLEKYGVPETPDDLLNHNCLTHSSIHHFNDWEFHAGNDIKVLSISGNFRTNSASALHEAVKAGIGIARLATFVTQPSLDSGELVPLLTEHTHDTSNILAVYPHRRHLSTRVRAFIDFLIGKFTPSPPWDRSQH
jgi:DNA-binding transcriptional LysR family regulator